MHTSDGTSRVQIVNSQKNKLFNELIEKFYVETGIPVLLNTSFNLRGEPIVNNTVDAIETFRDQIWIAFTSETLK